ncbi:Stress responsive alpha-beta barrel [Trema orientale]|uniref:Stress responsive alpha-beta barrel n=1 Tax=Trema orientale TaxID=63057 RepID=A0A2P5F5Q4_TREOI|nr:Stress responsive alpha-beta barrel [Trema orientale]
MEEAKGVVKHVLLAKFKEGTPDDQIEQLIKGYANLVNVIEPMKAFHCLSTEAVVQYVAHPVHVEYANLYKKLSWVSCCPLNIISESHVEFLY